MKMTFQPKKRQRAKVHGFRQRMKTAGGRKVIAARRLKGRKNYQHRPQFCGLFFILIVFRRTASNEIFRFVEKNKDFQNVYNNGVSFANRYLVMYVLKNNTENNRIGISVSKKVGNSVIRHHITRLVRESYRLHEDMFDSGLDIVVIARVAARHVGYKEIESAVLHLGGLHRIIKKQNI